MNSEGKAAGGTPQRDVGTTEATPSWSQAVGGVRIRPATPDDWPGVWAVLEPIFRAGTTYAIPQDISEDAARRYWMGTDRHTWVAEGPHVILGTFYLRANQAGPGRHVANAGYAVHLHSRGRGVAAAMCEHSQALARALGFRAMQFNCVVSTNTTAVALWQRLGFAVVGRLEGAFDHPEHGEVDALVLYKRLIPRSCTG